MYNIIIEMHVANHIFVLLSRAGQIILRVLHHITFTTGNNMKELLKPKNSSGNVGKTIEERNEKIGRRRKELQ